MVKEEYRNTYIKRYKSNNKLLQYNLNIKNLLEKERLDNQLDIDEIRRELFSGSEPIQGIEVKETESIFYHDLQNSKDKGEKV